MRLISLLVVAVALAAATSGCFGRDDDGDSGTTPTPTPTGSTPATPTGATPTTPTGPTPATPTPTAPSTPAPREVFTGNADFQRAPNPDPASPEAVTDNPFTVPAQYTTLTLNVTWSMATPAGVTSGATIEILDAAGTALTSCTVPQGPIAAAPAACTATTAVPATGGEYNARYRGEGTLQATVSIVAS